jgi:DNA-binding IclR family transcriptional regulator
MSRVSPSVTRIAAILRFMASHPGQAFSLTELARTLKISPATCSSLLAGLVQEDFLYRTGTKAFVLGPELAVIGRAAAEHASPLLVAQPEMRALADEFDVVCLASSLNDYTVEVHERAESVSSIGLSVPRGAKFRVTIPLAAVFIACWSDQQIRQWLGQYQPAPTRDQQDLQLKSIEFARKFGFVLFLGEDEKADHGFEHHAWVAIPAASLSLSTQYPVLSLTAPVFASRTQIAFSLSLAGFNRAMSGKEIVAVADKLKLACTRISDFIAGKRLSLRQLG